MLSVFLDDKSCSSDVKILYNGRDIFTGQVNEKRLLHVSE